MYARRLEQSKFNWAKLHQGKTVTLSPEQLQALIQGFALATHWTTAGGHDTLK
ncbi:IS66 family insertion sequence element accessory protein TnpB [Acinetobacter baumannii]|uniref:IS66 family insertion sequence element accessory protein TnpB n=1 Tax=Acinetobacter baumannii TaxID=470 RepID=UPI003891EF2C